jgi:hypothetical protein
MNEDPAPRTVDLTFTAPAVRAAQLAHLRGCHCRTQRLVHRVARLRSGLGIVCSNDAPNLAAPTRRLPGHGSVRTCPPVGHRCAPPRVTALAAS